MISEFRATHLWLEDVVDVSGWVLLHDLTWRWKWEITRWQVTVFKHQQKFRSLFQSCFFQHLKWLINTLQTLHAILHTCHSFKPVPTEVETLLLRDNRYSRCVRKISDDFETFLCLWIYLYNCFEFCRLSTR